MAECVVIKSIIGWNVGDHVEAFGSRLDELVSQGVIRVLVPDVKEEVKLEEPVKKRGRPSKK